MISIIVPIYNVEKELPRCIESLIRQTYKNLEIILVNDGSTDDSLNICKSFAATDNRIKIINKKNGGLSDARNCGIAVASGEYFMLVDSDDYIEEDSCEILMSGFINSDVDFVVGAMRIVDEKSGVSFNKHTNISPQTVYNMKEFTIASIRNNEWYAPAVLNLYKRDFFIKFNLNYKIGRYYEDMEMLPRIYLNAKNICYIDYCFYNYIIRDSSIMRSKITEKKTRDAVNNYIEWKKLFDYTEDDELRRYLYGYLLKCYLKSCRTHKIVEWMIPGVDYKFAKRYSLNNKERLKALFFDRLPDLYVRINR